MGVWDEEWLDRFMNKCTRTYIGYNVWRFIVAKGKMHQRFCTKSSIALCRRNLTAYMMVDRRIYVDLSRIIKFVDFELALAGSSSHFLHP
ncbi:hypothetical protein BDN70DRAFT_555952 [Pholiota conissans]|uniref:Uncharacterized protein n=1 Tax=Pholiota conissans TaxID=109636 RepID=A0A9P5YLZ8_9AGAR|nr:hypothetical protein BDN70DRAFT_555952 [Pholiota conissans]